MLYQRVADRIAPLTNDICYYIIYIITSGASNKHYKEKTWKEHKTPKEKQHIIR